MIRKILVIGLLCLFTTPAIAAECKATVESTDAMQFKTGALVVPAACKQFAITLKHTGKLPRNVMGHNLVLGRTVDVGAINADGMKAGLANQYVKPGDARVLAASKVIGGGESTTVNIPVGKLKAGESYTYFCSFPGHAALMKGTLSVGK